ncbi:replication protein [Neokomagataea anthophila]|nr:replication protein [Neokomagataea anthophila]
MSETNQLLHQIQTSQTKRNRQENVLSSELQSALKKATEASQNALQASNVEFRANLLGVGSTALLTLLIASGAGYWIGHRSGLEQGQAEGYHTALDERAAASWANTPAGQRAYRLDQQGSLDMFTRCVAPGWIKERQKDGVVCYPKPNADGLTSGWYLP